MITSLFTLLFNNVNNVTNQAVDTFAQYDGTDINQRNAFIYESCDPIAHLYSPIYELDDAFVLQEFFVPAKNFVLWINNAKMELSKLQVHKKLVILLNLTIRYVFEDKTTTLAYSRTQSGSYAFVLYYRLKKTSEADKILKKVHEALASLSISLGGTFYLPYRHHYSVQQLKKAYPNIENFFQIKLKHDPHGIFNSAWSDNYFIQMIPEYKKISRFQAPIHSDLDQDLLLEKPHHFELRIVEEHREDSYRRLMRNPVQRNEFIEHFFENIFNIESKDKLKNLMAKAVADPRNNNDADIYGYIKQHLEESDGLFNQVTKAVKAVMQSSRQRRELVKETVTILHRLKRLGHVNGLVSIGDSGKLVRELVENKFIVGKVWVVHDKVDNGYVQVMERASEKEVGQFVPIDYENPCFLLLPSETADLVTLNIGMHHFPQNCIIPFLKEVNRVLRPGGLFMVREHDANPELIPVLDLAHSIFNAVTNATEEYNRNERRAFRPILEWRQIIESVGFEDTYLYEMEKGDPTLDEMMCFSKGSLEDFVITTPVIDLDDEKDHELDQHDNETCPASYLETKFFVENVEGSLEAIANNLPEIFMNMARSGLDEFTNFLVNGKTYLESMAKTFGLSEGQVFIVRQFLNKIINPLIHVLNDFRPVLNSASRKNVFLDIVPDELIAVIKAALKRAEDGEASKRELTLVWLIKSAQEKFVGKSSSKTPYQKALLSNEENGVVTPQVGLQEEVEEVLERLLRVMPELRRIDTLTNAGFKPSVVVMLKSQIGDDSKPLTSKRITKALMPYLDEYSWNKMKTPLEEIIQNPSFYPLTEDYLTDGRNAWYQVLKGFFSGKSVQFNAFGIGMANVMGLSTFIDIWSDAQQTRLSEEKQGVNMEKDLQSWQLSFNAKNMLSNAIGIFKQDTENKEDALSQVLACLKLARVVSEENVRPEFTWFKLVEWLQVEYVQIFGSYMHHRPWYQFPYADMMKKYFTILYEEVQIVNEKHGIQKALFSEAFVTDLMPGLVMSFILGQVAAMALPLRFVWGDNYSKGIVN